MRATPAYPLFDCRYIYTFITFAPRATGAIATGYLILNCILKSLCDANFRTRGERLDFGPTLLDKVRGLL